MIKIRVPSSGGGYTARPLGPCVNVTSAFSGSKGATISWTDPDDYYIGDRLVSEWFGTKLVRKEGSYPEDEEDGTLVVNSTVRNQYSVNGYTDASATRNSYYALFPYAGKIVFTSGDETHVATTISDHTITVIYDGKQETLTVEDGAKPDLSSYEKADSTGHDFDGWDKPITEATSDTT